MSNDTKISLRITDIELALGGKYKIIDKVGTGGFGEVYLGEHTQLRRKVAIKILASNLAGQQDVVKRFEREARAAATLSHPNIIDIYDVGESGEIYYFVMKYIDGETLSEKMQREKKFPPGEAIHIIKQVADALDYAHEHDIIHRDIKPANVMLDEYAKPVLMDFGVARVQFESNLTKTGTLMGTPHYLPPELPLGKKVDGRSDIYSLGIMLYEMLSGRPPYHDENSVALIFKHINETPEPLKQLEPNMDPALSDIVHKMIEKLPENRYQTAGEVVDALHELQSIYPPVMTAGRRSTPTGSRNTEKLLLLAQEHVQKDKFSKAIELYATISRRDPNNETAKREISELIGRLVEKIRDHVFNEEIAQARELLKQAAQLSFKDERLSSARMELEEEEKKLKEQKEQETAFGINFDAAALALDRDQPAAAIDALSDPAITLAVKDEAKTQIKETPKEPPKAQTLKPEEPTGEIPRVAPPRSMPVQFPTPAPAASVSLARKWAVPAIVLVIVAVAGGLWMFSQRPVATTSDASNDPMVLHRMAANRLKTENPSVPAKPTTGQLSITSTPDGARVFLGDEQKGVTPLKIADLPLGKYQLKLQLKGYKDLEQDVELTPDSTSKEVPLVLEASAPVIGTLTIDSKPQGAVIVLNNRAIGVTPKTLANANVGKYNVGLNMEGFQDFSETVRVKDGQTTTVSAELVAIPKPVVVAEKPKEPEVKPGTLVTLGPDVIPPRSIKKSSPKYPESRDKKLEGTVRLSILVSETGRVIDVKVTQSSNAKLEQAAVEAVRQWIYEPAKKKGVVVKVWVPVVVTFQVQHH